MANLELRIGGQDFEATPQNMFLYQFIGEAAMYNHVFIVREQLPNDMYRATYVFNDSPTYKTLVDHIVQNDFPMHLNLLEPAKPDIEAWNENFLGDLNDINEVPDEWTKS